MLVFNRKVFVKNFNRDGLTDWPAGRYGGFLGIGYVRPGLNLFYQVLRKSKDIPIFFIAKLITFFPRAFHTYSLAVLQNDDITIGGGGQNLAEADSNSHCNR